MSILSNLRKRGLRDLLNPKKWKIFARSLALRALKKEYSEMFVPEYLEQVSIRMSNPNCRTCLENGECLHCGCKTPDLFFEKSMECSGLNWFSMLDPISWKEHRDSQDIRVDPDYIDQIKKHGKIINFKD
jgi:hypothetical protein